MMLRSDTHCTDGKFTCLSNIRTDRIVYPSLQGKNLPFTALLYLISLYLSFVFGEVWSMINFMVVRGQINVEIL